MEILHDCLAVEDVYEAAKTIEHLTGIGPFELFDPNSPQLASDFFFNGGKFSNQTVLLAWEYNHIPLTVNALLSSYFPHGGAPTAPGWPGEDYDTIWTVTLDAQGNLTVDNTQCEGIQSVALPAACPQF